MKKRVFSSLTLSLVAAIVSVTIFFLVENERLSISLIIGVNTFIIMSIDAKSKAQKNKDPKSK